MKAYQEEVILTADLIYRLVIKLEYNEDNNQFKTELIKKSETCKMIILKYIKDLKT